jgi:hypothetical protein
MNETTLTFPKARLDAMSTDAKAFNPYKFDTMDAAESAFIARQLEQIRPGLIEVAYPALKGEQLVPMNFGFDPGAESYTIRIMNKVGEVKVVRDLTTAEIPNVEMSVTEKSVQFFSLATGYMYSLQEARAAIMARMPLNARKAMIAREMMARKMDDIALTGNTELGLLGLFTQTGTTTYATPNGSGGDTEFSTKSADEILIDLNGATHKIVLDTLEAHVPDTMVLPLSIRDVIATRRVGDGTDRSVLQYFLANSLYVTTVEQSTKLESNTGWTGKRGLVYKKDPTILEMLISQPFEQMAPQVQGFTTQTLCHGRTAGVVTYFPKALAYFDQL